MDKQSVLERFAALAQLSPEEAAECSGLADAAISEAKSRLREDLREEWDADVLNHLCAAICYYHYCLLETGDEESVRTGDVSVTKRKTNRVENARSLRDAALATAKKYLSDDRFYFGRTC